MSLLVSQRGSEVLTELWGSNPALSASKPEQPHVTVSRTHCLHLLPYNDHWLIFKFLVHTISGGVTLILSI